MTGWFDAALHWQRQVLDAQKATLDAGGHAHAMAAATVQAQEAGRRAMQANLAAWTAWSQAWGIGRW